MANPTYGTERFVCKQGARQVIDAISSRKLVAILTLSHIQLGDEGCEELFNYLCSAAGRKYKIVEIHLFSNHIGDRGLIAISEYLKGNSSLKDLLIQDVRIISPLPQIPTNPVSSSRDVECLFRRPPCDAHLYRVIKSIPS